jgi:hypothetical protein
MGARPSLLLCHCSVRLLLCCSREKKQEGGRREQKRKEKEGKEKRKNMKKFPNLKIFGEKNKRQFMK